MKLDVRVHDRGAQFVRSRRLRRCRLLRDAHRRGWPAAVPHVRSHPPEPRTAPGSRRLPIPARTEPLPGSGRARGDGQAHSSRHPARADRVPGECAGDQRVVTTSERTLGHGHNRTAPVELLQPPRAGSTVRVLAAASPMWCRCSGRSGRAGSSSGIPWHSTSCRARAGSLPSSEVAGSPTARRTSLYSRRIARLTVGSIRARRAASRPIRPFLSGRGGPEEESAGWTIPGGEREKATHGSPVSSWPSIGPKHVISATTAPKGSIRWALRIWDTWPGRCRRRFAGNC